MATGKRGDGNGTRPRSPARKKARAVAEKREREKGRYNVSLITPQARAKFIEQLRELPNIAYAADIAGHSRQAFYALRKRDPEFAEQWEEAIAYAVGEMEEAARKRAIDGVVTRRQFDKEGNVVGEETTYSDRLLQAMLQAHHPSYRSKHEFSGPGGGPMQMSLAELANEARKTGDEDES